MQKECNVVMLPTNKAENALLLWNDKQLEYTKGYLTQEYLKYINAESYHLYITSDDEIKDDDWCIRNKIVEQCNSKMHSFALWGKNAKKIIATTDNSLIIKGEVKIQHGRLTEYFPTEKKLLQPSQEFIELFLKNYNAGNSIAKVMVEYEEYDGHNEISHYLKINPDNTINIKTIKDSWSRDDNDLKTAFENFACAVYNENHNKDMSFRKRAEIMSKEWIKQNL